MVCSLIAGNGIDAITSKFYATVIYQRNKEFIPLFLRGEVIHHERLAVAVRPTNQIYSCNTDDAGNGTMKTF
jgi:hypothetical protein